MKPDTETVISEGLDVLAGIGSDYLKGDVEEAYRKAVYVLTGKVHQIINSLGRERIGEEGRDGKNETGNQ